MRDWLSGCAGARVECLVAGGLAVDVLWVAWVGMGDGEGPLSAHGGSPIYLIYK